MLTFSRSEDESELATSLAREGFAIDVVRERHRFDFRVFAQLRAIVDRIQPDVLWTHGSKTHFLARLAGLHRGRTWIAFHHGYTETSLVWTLYEQLDRWSLRGADRVMTACEAFAADLNARLGIDAERLRVHRSPIAARSQPPLRREQGGLRAELGLSPDERVVVSVGRLSKEKGYADLIAAMAEVRQNFGPRTALVIVGEGPERTHLESIRNRLGLTGSVHLAGYQPDVSAYYELADVFALTSYSEGSPNVLLEAMDAGVPIVATAVGGVVEMIRDREHGLLVPAGAIGAIAGGIVTLLHDADLRLALATAARESLSAYAPERYYASIRSVFEESVTALPARRRG